MSKTILKGPRIRGMVYETAFKGNWTYYVRVGDLATEGNENTFHPDVTWSSRKNAEKGLKKVVDDLVGKVTEHGGFVVRDGGKE